MSLEHQRNAISIFLPYLKEDSTQVYKSVLLCGIPMKWKTKATSCQCDIFYKKKAKKGMVAINLAPDCQKMFHGDVLENLEKKKTAVKQLNGDKR